MTLDVEGGFDRAQYRFSASDGVIGSDHLESDTAARSLAEVLRFGGHAVIRIEREVSRDQWREVPPH